MFSVQIAFSHFHFKHRVFLTKYIPNHLEVTAITVSSQFRHFSPKHDGVRRGESWVKANLLTQKNTSDTRFQHSFG